MAEYVGAPACSQPGCCGTGSLSFATLMLLVVMFVLVVFGGHDPDLTFTVLLTVVNSRC
jgi:hypothetical protein